MRTAEQLKQQYRAGSLDEDELERRLERLAEREGIEALTLPDPGVDSAGPQEVERGMSRWFAVATMLVTVAVAVPSSDLLQAIAVGGAVLAVAAGVLSMTVYSYRRETLPRASAP